MKVFMIETTSTHPSAVLVEAVSEKEALKTWAAHSASVRKLTAAEVLAEAGKLPVLRATPELDAPPAA